MSAADCAFVKAAINVSERASQMHHADRIVPQGAMNEHAPVAGEAMLLRCRPTIERIAGCALLPSYAFWRIYGTGAALLSHVDRGACE